MLSDYHRQYYQINAERIKVLAKLLRDSEEPPSTSPSTSQFDDFALFTSRKRKEDNPPDDHHGKKNKTDEDDFHMTNMRQYFSVPVFVSTCINKNMTVVGIAACRPYVRIGCLSERRIFDELPIGLALYVVLAVRFTLADDVSRMGCLGMEERVGAAAYD